jgi:hypothetical protein
MKTSPHPTEILVDRICKETLQAFGRACLGKKLTDAQIAKASAFLKVTVKEEYPTLVAEMAEADRAFFGQDQMINLVFSVGCAAIAARAFKHATS